MLAKPQKTLTPPPPAFLIVFSLLLTTFLCLNLKPIQAQAQNEDVPFFTWDATTSTLTFAYGDATTAGGTQIQLSGYTSDSEREWDSYVSDVTGVIVADSFAQAPQESLAYWFCGMDDLREITGLRNLNGKNTVTNMSWMFYYCYSLTSLDLSGFDTANVTNMSYMFHECSALASLDLSGFDTSSVENMSFMFEYCLSLTALDLSGLDTSKATDMSYMFYCCSALTSLDLSGIDTSGVQNMSYMFSNCQALTSLDLSNFNTANVTNMSSMFSSSSALASLDLSGFDTSNVDNMRNMFLNCKGLASLDLSNFNTSNVSDMENMFNGCSPTLLVLNRNASSVVPSVSATWSVFENGTTTFCGTSPDIATFFDDATHTGTYRFIRPSNVNTLAVSFFSNGGNFIAGKRSTNNIQRWGHVSPDGSASKVIAPDLSSGSPIKLNAPEGYSFAGWAMSPDATEPIQDFPSFIETPLNFYAIYKEGPAPAPSPTPDPEPQPTPEPIAKTGWIWTDAGWMYGLEDGSYIQDQWSFINGSWYYFKTDGVIYTNCWAWIGDAWYGFWSAGQMCTGWVWDSGYQAYFYCGTSGAMVSGVWDFIDGEWYGFWANGTMCTGWIWDSGYNAWFYCYTNGVMARNAWIGNYWMNASGMWV